MFSVICICSLDLPDRSISNTPSLEDITSQTSNFIEFLHTFFDFIINYISITPVFFLFICITAIIITAIIVHMATPVPGSEGISDIPGAVYIPPTVFGESIPDNKMPGKYAPNDKKWPIKFYPPLEGPDVGSKLPVEPQIDVEPKNPLNPPRF